MATETRKPTAAIAPFGLRMQPDLRAQIEAAAEASGRSMNAEIVARLEESLCAEVIKKKDRHETNSLAYFISSLMNIAEYGKEFGDKVKIEVNISGGLKEALPPSESAK